MIQLNRRYFDVSEDPLLGDDRVSRLSASSPKQQQIGNKSLASVV